MTDTNAQAPEVEDRPDVEQQETLGQSIRDLVERTFLLGVGAATMTRDRVQAVVEEFVQRGQLSTEEGLHMVDQMIERGRQEAESIFKKADSSLKTAYKDVGLASRNEVEDFEFRLRQLEHRVSLLEDASDRQKDGPEDGPGNS